MTFTWPFKLVTSPKGGIVIMWSTSRLFFEVTLFQQILLFFSFFSPQQMLKFQQCSHDVWILTLECQIQKFIWLGQLTLNNANIVNKFTLLTLIMWTIVDVLTNL